MVDIVVIGIGVDVVVIGIDVDVVGNDLTGTVLA